MWCLDGTRVVTLPMIMGTNGCRTGCTGMNPQHSLRPPGQTLLDLDHTVHETAEDHRKNPVVRAMAWLSQIGDQPQLRLLSGGLIVAGLARSDARMAAAGARMLLAHELATACKSFIKHRVDRKRPRSAGSRGQEQPHAGHSHAKEDNSFPSGHSAGATAVACAFAAVYPQHGNAARLAAGAVALAQIPRCAHYPTDVAAGIAIGVAADAAVGLALCLAREAGIPISPAPGQ